MYTICEKIGGTANIRLVKASGEEYRMVFDLSEGTDRSVMQEENPHIVFSDAYSNLLSFSYAEDIAIQRNFAYIYGQGKGADRKNTTYCVGEEPAYLDRYELYVDADDIAEEQQIDGETVPIPEDEYIALLQNRGSEKLVLPKTASESEIAAHNTQYVYNKDYGDRFHHRSDHRNNGQKQAQQDRKTQLQSGLGRTCKEILHPAHGGGRRPHGHSHWHDLYP